MITIYRPTDVIEYKVRGITIAVSPLSKEQKFKLSAEAKSNMKDDSMSFDQQDRHLKNLLKASIKRVENFEAQLSDGTPVTLEWKDGHLTDESVELLCLAIGHIPSTELSTGLQIDNFEFRNLARIQKQGGEDDKKKAPL